MPLPNIFDLNVSEAVIARIASLHPNSPAKWGKMNVSQMLAHCCVTYEMIYENKHKKPNFFMRLILKWFVKKSVTNDTLALAKNSPTAPEFVMSSEKDFEVEKTRLIDFIRKTQQMGESFFDKKESLGFGILSKTEWNNLMYKHLEHHLQQFGA